MHMSGGVISNFQKQNSTGRKVVINDHEEINKKGSAGCTIRSCSFNFKLPKRWELISPVRYLKQLGVRLVAVARPPPPKDRAPAKTSVAPLDSQRAEAISDCIDFINSSVSSLPRSNSATVHSNTIPDHDHCHSQKNGHKT